MGTGLMILSKHPIVDFETLSFKNQYFAESFGVNRGALWARVKPPNSPPIDVFTLHTTASVREALLKGAPEFVLAAGDTARLGQFREIREFVEERRESKTSACVVAGDFNANIKWTKGKPDRGYAIDAVEETMVKGLGFEDCGWEVSYGYSPMDKILTNPNHPEGTAVRHATHAHLWRPNDPVRARAKRLHPNPSRVEPSPLFADSRSPLEQSHHHKPCSYFALIGHRGPNFR